jgi:two-component system, OmpR family, sensor kinase
MSRPRWQTRYARLPIRARLTIAFVGVMAAVLAAAGVYLYAQFRADLDAQINNSLRVEGQDVEALVDAGGPHAVADSDAPFAQVYSAAGTLLTTTRKPSGFRLLSVKQAIRAATRTQKLRTEELPSGPVRILAMPASSSGPANLALAVAEPLRLRDHELAHLRKLLLVSGPLALLLASVAGYELARAALRPVDRMRAELEAMSDQAGLLAVPDTADEIGALGRTLNELLRRVRIAVARERRLVSDASHELRTPLTTLRAEVDLALLGDREPEELRAALRSAAEEARRMSRLADDLLVLARADQGRLPLNPKQLRISELLDAAAARARAAADVQSRRIEVVPADGATVLADPDRTAQALGNLLTNALVYGAGTIGLEAREQGERIELHVTDEGPGFPEDLLPRAFERFGRGEQARSSTQGSGLGLAIVEAVAVAQGGTAHARNRPEGGADVWIELPRA